MLQPKFLTYDEWLKNYRDIEDDEEDCDDCDGIGNNECHCVECGDEHEVECSSCDGTGFVPVTIRLYEEQKIADKKRWETYNEQFKEGK